MDEASSRTPVALITGVGPGLGTSLCRRLSEEGYAVAGLARSTDHTVPPQETLTRHGARFRFVQCDVADAGVIQGAVTVIEPAWDSVSVLATMSATFSSNPS